MRATGLSKGSQSVDLGPTVITSPEKLLEMQIFKLNPKPIESETLGIGLGGLCVFNKPSRFQLFIMRSHLGRLKHVEICYIF